MSLSEEPTWEPMNREHVTDGSPCWCEPETVSFRPATAEYVVSKHSFRESDDYGDPCYVLPIQAECGHLRFYSDPARLLIEDNEGDACFLIPWGDSVTEAQVDAFVAAFRLGET